MLLNSGPFGGGDALPVFGSGFYSEGDMPIRYQHVETVTSTPDLVFAAINDLP